MASNRALTRAARAQQDEFYTTTGDIERELMYYREHFTGKKILCNCDDPFESKFFEYFAIRFQAYGLAKLTATSYAGSPIAQRQLLLFEEDKPARERTPYCATLCELKDYNGDGRTDRDDVIWALQNIPGALRKLEGDGDFRSRECIELLKDADIVVTNPPHSLLREYVALLMDYSKKFIILANINAVTYKEIFPLIMQNKLWLGKTIHSGDRKFYVPESYPLEAAGCGIDDEGRRFIRVKGVRWFTNLEVKQRYCPLAIFKHYTPEEYPHYDNYDAIEVSKTSEIPCDYAGVMGVPITFLDKYNPEQFEIVGMSGSNFAGGVPECHISGTSLNAQIDGKNIYRRLFIRRKQEANS